MKQTITIMLVLAIVVLGVFAIRKSSVSDKPAITEPVACTVEAKICPDGSSVGRSGPHCEFAACPTSVTQKTIKINERSLVNGIYITPLKVMEDSRCATDVQCIWAGRITVNAKLETLTGNVTKELVFTEGPYTTPFEGKVLSFIATNPAQHSKQTINPSDYEFTFKVEDKDPTHADLITVSTPTPNDVVKSPLTIKGQARGTWFFEASFPVKILDANGKELGAVAAQAKEDWMTTEFVPFEASLTFTKPTTATGTLILQKDNPSGDPSRDDSISIPVRF